MEVTKVKSEGRVAGGKRLAEWNRKNKDNLRKNKDQVDASGGQVDASGGQVDASESSSALLCSGGWLGAGVLVLVGGGIALYLNRQRFCRKPVQAQAPAEKKQPKIYME